MEACINFKNDMLNACVGEGVLRIKEYLSEDTLRKFYECLQIKG